MAAQNFEKFDIAADFYKFWYYEIFEIPEYEFVVKIPKFKMADPIWLPKIS